MAKVKFRIRSNSNKIIPVKVRLLNGKNTDIEINTEFFVNTKDWSETNQLPIQNNAVNKKLFKDLKKLESFIFDKLNESQSKGELINRYWLQNVINDCFDRVAIDETDNNLLTVQTQFIIDNANTRKIKGSNRIGLSINRIKGYVTFLNLIKNYEVHLKKEVRLTDINSVFVGSFTNWLMNKNNYSVNYSGKQIDNLKTVCIDSLKRGIKTNDFVHNIESFKDNKENKYIVTLSFNELEQIRTKHLTKESLINVRKWLLLGCEIGQRGGDLLNLTKKNIRHSNNVLLLDVHQQKTGKDVTVPITKDYIENILLKEFPRKISIQKFNTYLKEICKECKINEPTKGKVFDSKTKRKKLDTYPKHELITSHICRRSFATNYYKSIPTPILIEITGHSKESMFLEYIGKPKDKDENANLFLKLVQEMNSNKESILKAV